MSDTLPKIEIDSPDALWDWLADHHKSDDSYLLVTYKKSSPERYVSRDEVLDALLAFGWIDGRRYALDETRTMQLICKRKQQAWTQSYRTRAEALLADDRMQPSGLVAIKTAQKTGQWLANQDVDALLCPNDLTAALQAQNGYEWWQSAAPSYQRNILRWLSTAKTDTTRQKRCAEIATACAAGKKIKNR